MKGKDMQIAFSFGFTMIMSMGVAVYLGYKIDEFLHTTPLFIVILAAYVVISGFVYLYRKISGDENE